MFPVPGPEAGGGGWRGRAGAAGAVEPSGWAGVPRPSGAQVGVKKDRPTAGDGAEGGERRAPMDKKQSIKKALGALEAVGADTLKEDSSKDLLGAAMDVIRL